MYKESGELGEAFRMRTSKSQNNKTSKDDVIQLPCTNDGSTLIRD